MIIGTKHYIFEQDWSFLVSLFKRFFWDKRYVDSNEEETKVEEIVAGKYIPPRRVVHIGKDLDLWLTSFNLLYRYEGRPTAVELPHLSVPDPV